MRCRRSVRCDRLQRVAEDQNAIWRQLGSGDSSEGGASNANSDYEFVDDTDQGSDDDAERIRKEFGTITRYDYHNPAVQLRIADGDKMCWEMIDQSAEWAIRQPSVVKKNIL